jgi:hypothetical protein
MEGGVWDVERCDKVVVADRLDHERDTPKAEKENEADKVDEAIPLNVDIKRLRESDSDIDKVRVDENDLESPGESVAVSDGLPSDDDFEHVSEFVLDRSSVAVSDDERVRESEVLLDVESTRVGDIDRVLDSVLLREDVVDSESSGVALGDDVGERENCVRDNVPADGEAETVVSLVGVHVDVNVPL